MERVFSAGRVESNAGLLWAGVLRLASAGLWISEGHILKSRRLLLEESLSLSYCGLSAGAKILSISGAPHLNSCQSLEPPQVSSYVLVWQRLDSAAQSSGSSDIQ